jgi:YVTN family beta-propeller protein
MTPVRVATNTPGKTIRTGAHVFGPHDLAITPNGRTLYLLGGTVIPVRTASNTVGKAIRVGSDPSAIAVTPNGKTAYVANSGSGTVTPINTATNKAGPAIRVGRDPSALVITPNGKTVYVANFASGTVTRSGPPPTRPDGPSPSAPPRAPWRSPRMARSSWSPPSAGTR